MSAILNFQSLTGILDLAQDAIAEWRFKSVGGNQVYGLAQQVGQTILQARKSQQAHGPGKLHQDVDVAFGTGLSPDYRAE